jgi:hypothetical protein
METDDISCADFAQSKIGNKEQNGVNIGVNIFCFFMVSNHLVYAADFWKALFIGVLEGFLIFGEG